jgi:hypothetical protein
MSTIRNRLESPFDYNLDKAIVTSSAFVEGAEIDIKNVITDIDIYEHLDKPYLTGSVLWVDDNGLYNAVDFSGMERLNLEFSLPIPEATPIRKTFIIEKTTKNIRGNDRSTAILFHIIEEHAFVSALKNVNKAYTGKPVEIIQKIIEDNLDREFSTPIIDDVQQPIKVVIPNMHPLQAAKWVRDRATTTDGLPYYFFSTFANSKMHIIPLDEMLTTNPDPKPYLYSQMAASLAASSTVQEQAYLIQDFKVKSNDEVLSLIKKGMIGSQNYYYDTASGGLVENRGTFFNLDQLMQDLARKDIIARNQNRINYTKGYQLNGIDISRIKSTVNTNLVTTNTYQGYNNYSEASSLAAHKLKFISETMRDVVVRNPVEVILPGFNFLEGSYSNTIGNQIRLRFLNSTTTQGGGEQIDTKKSGDYLIYAVKHQFKKERYDLIASCVKLSDLPQEERA